MLQIEIASLFLVIANHNFEMATITDHERLIGRKMNLSGNEGDRRHIFLKILKKRLHLQLNRMNVF